MSWDGDEGLWTSETKEDVEVKGNLPEQPLKSCSSQTVRRSLCVRGSGSSGFSGRTSDQTSGIEGLSFHSGTGEYTLK